MKDETQLKKTDPSKPNTQKTGIRPPQSSNKQPAKPSQEPVIIKNYQLLGLLGKGGMGEVYLAKHPTLNRKIVLKKLKTKNRDDIRRFLQEAKVMLDFRHENIVQVFDHFEEKSHAYIAMEYIQGKSLSDIIKEYGKIPFELALYILYQTALGLYHAHSKKVIHRDIKPHNIMISVNGEVKITDFGIARKQNDTDEKTITAPDTIIGTPAYMSPEQFSGSKEVTHSTDIYSLGVVFYEMLTGIRPFKNECSSEVIDAITRKKCDSLKKHLKKPQSIVVSILNKTFNPIAKKRYATLYPLIKLLRNYFKHYNILEVKDAVKRLVANDKKIRNSIFYQSISLKQKKTKIKSLLSLTLIFIVVLSIIVYQTDSVYKYLLYRTYGKATLEFQKANLDPNNVFFGINNKYYKATFDEKGKFKKEIYLKSNEHEFTVVSGSYKNKKRSVIYPLSVTENNYVNIPIDNLKQKGVIVYFRFWDAINQQKLLYRYDALHENPINAPEDYLFIKNRSGENYLPLSEYARLYKNNERDVFLTNNKYELILKNFQQGKVKYQDKSFSISFALDDRTVVYHANLTPMPGRISINHSGRRPKILIDGKKSGLLFTGTDYNITNFNTVKSVIENDKSTINIDLPPGKYNIKTGTYLKSITINSNEVINIHL